MKKSKLVLCVLAILLTLTVFGCNFGGGDYVINVSTVGQGTVLKTPEQPTYQFGSKVELIAVASTGWRFDHWEGAGYQGNTSYAITVTVSENVSLKAVFIDLQQDQGEYSSTISTPLTNNSAIITADGFKMGYGITNNNLLRKELKVTVTNPNSDFQVDRGYAVRTQSSSEGVYIVLPVTNISQTGYGFIQVDGVVYKDSNGVVLEPSAYSYIDGSVGKSAYSTTQTSLFPGETGYFLDILSEDVYSMVDTIEVTTVNAVTGFIKPQASLIPNGLQYTKKANYDSFTVSVVNSGTQTANMSGNLQVYILLDDQSLPLDFGYLDVETPVDGLVGASATGTIIETSFKYDGTGSKMLVMTNFEEYIPAATSTSDFSTLLSERKSGEMLNEHNRQIDAKYRKFLELKNSTK